MDKLQFFYNKDTDILYLSVGDPRSAISEELGEDVLLRLDVDTGEEVGLTLLNFLRHFDAGEALAIPVGVKLYKLGATSKRLDQIHGSMLSDTDFQRLMSKCTNLLPIEDAYLVDDYIENLMFTVLDFQLHSTTVGRAMTHYRTHVQTEMVDFDALKDALDRYPNTREGNRQAAQYLWGYNLWTRVEMLRNLLIYFEAEGITTQEHLRIWAVQADFERDFKGRIKGLGYAVFQWLLMRQGVESIKPDVWIHRFIRDTLGYDVSDEMAVAMLKEIALELDVKAYMLDYSIWQYQRNL